MKSFNKINNNLLIINILFIFFPLSFILGNLFINLNIILIFFFSFYLCNLEIRKFKLNFIDKIITLFFIYTFFVLLINFFEAKIHGENFSLVIISKTFLFLRYYLLYITLRLLIVHNFLKINWFFLSCSFLVIFVCFDIYFQYFIGKDIFGFIPVSSFKLSGPFGEELIAGGYIQRFCLFAFFLSFILNKEKSLHRILIQISLAIVFLCAIVLSGNRISLFIFLFSIVLLFLFDKKKKKNFIAIIMVLTLVLSLLLSYNKNFKTNSLSFYAGTKNLVNFFIKSNISLEESVLVIKAPYVLEFFCFNHVWKKNIFFGGGIKSYRINSSGCNTHPHNYYFEILDDLGLFGFLIIVFLFFSILYKLFKNRYILNSQVNLNQQIIPIFFLFFLEFFPIRSTGSFFSTGNSAFIFIVLALLVSLMQKHEEKEKLVSKNLKN